MLTRFRQWRWLAGLLVVLSPPVAGYLIPLIDPCPVDTPWLLSQNDTGQHSGGQHDSDPHAGHAEPASSGGSHTEHANCHCIGACTGAAVIVAPQAGVVLAEVPETFVQFRGAPASPDRAGRPRFLLPPSHAPPVV